MNNPTARIFQVPIILEIEADNPQVAIAAAETIRETIRRFRSLPA